MVVGFVFSIFTLMKTSDAYGGAVARARVSPAVIKAIGSPIKEGIFVSGSVSVSGSSGDAELSIPIRGPIGKATIQVVARKTEGRWHFEKLLVHVHSSGEWIDLNGEIGDQALKASEMRLILKT